MCDVAQIAISTANTIASVLKSVYTAKTTQKIANQEAQQYISLAEEAKEDAAYERQTGIEDARKQRLQAILNMGDKEAAIAAGNISTSSQTALNIIDDERLNGELDALTTLRDSEQKAQNYLSQADQYYAKASLTSLKSQSQFTSSLLGLSGNIFSLSSEYVDYFKSSTK